MSKITIETKKGHTLEYHGREPKVSEEECQKVSQITLRTLALLEEIGWGNRVEIIKATVCKDMELSQDRNSMVPVLLVDFQLVFCPPLAPTLKPNEEKLKVVGSWSSFVNEIWIYKDEVSSNGEFLQQINLQDAEVETLAKALIETMRARIHDRQSYLERVIEWLRKSDAELESLIEAPAEA